MTGGVNSASEAMKLIVAVRSGGQPSQPICTGVPEHQIGDLRFGHEEAHEHVAGGQDRNHGRAVAGIFALAEIDILDAARDQRACTARSERLNAAVSRVAVACFACASAWRRAAVAWPCCACVWLRRAARAVVGRLARFRDRGAATRRCAPDPAGARALSAARWMSASICACSACACANCAAACWPCSRAAAICACALSRAARLADRVEREQRIALFHLCAARHVQRGDPAGLRRRDQHRFAFDIAEPARVFLGRAGSQQHASSRRANRPPHAARSSGCNPRSNVETCASIEPRIVVWLAVERREGRAPDRRQQQRRHAQPHGVLHRHLAELAALHPGLQQASEQGQPALDDFLAVDAREIGEVAGFRDDHLGQHHEIAGAR